MPKPKISLITVTYNSASTLVDTLNSVLNQTYSNVEYIVVDGNSSDNTPSLMEDYKERFGKKLIYIREADKGLYDAMNKGIKRATGEVVGFLNSDDFFTRKDILETIAHEFEQAPLLDALYGDVHYVDPENVTKEVRYYSSRFFSPRLMRLGFMPAHPSFYCKKSVYEQFGCFRTDYRIAADFELLLRFIFIHRIKTLYLPFDFVTMRAGGLSSSGWKSHKNIMKDHHRALKENHVKSSYFLMSFRYFYKALEVLLYRVKSIAR